MTRPWQKKIMQRMESNEHIPENSLHDWYSFIGETAAVLGDSTTTQRMMKKILDMGYHFLVSEIAATMGDIQTAQEMLSEAKKRDRIFGEYSRYFVASKYNPEAVLHMIKPLQNAGVEIGPIAIHILEDL
jgi:hypothetical protein